MQDRAVRLRAIALARDTLQLAPGLAARISIGADVAPLRASRNRSNPALDRTAAACRQCVGVLGWRSSQVVAHRAP
jgi:hypothetical protein